MRKIALLAVASAALLAAGCGSSNNDKGLSKAEYVKQANAICKQGNAAINTAAQALGQSPTTAQLNAFVTTALIPSIEAQLKSLRALKAPKDDADKLSGFYDDADAALAKIKATPGLATANGPDDPFAAVNKETTAYGLTECGSSS